MWLTLALTAFAADTRYVQASTLNLRAEPTPDGTVRKILDINDEVDVVSVEGTFAKVRFEGKEGWVAVDFLAPEPLTVEAAMSGARDSEQLSERLSWLQRAAAIRPDDAVLEELESAYRAIGDGEAADQIARERKWPRTLILVAADGPPEIELSEGQSSPSDGQGAPVTPADFERRFGFALNSKGWLLPDGGPAVEAQLAGARLEEISPCGSGWGTVAYVAAGLPYGRQPIAFTREKPPPSWVRSSPASGVPETVAQKAADTWQAKLTTGAETERWIVPMPDGWFVRVARGDSPGIPEISKWQYVDLRVTAKGTEDGGIQDHASAFGGPAEPISVRDVNGDGELDLVQRTPCGREVTSLTGDDLAFTTGRCCD